MKTTKLIAGPIACACVALALIGTPASARAASNIPTDCINVIAQGSNSYASVQLLYNHCTLQLQSYTYDNTGGNDMNVYSYIIYFPGGHQVATNSCSSCSSTFSFQFHALACGTQYEGAGSVFRSQTDFKNVQTTPAVTLC